MDAFLADDSDGEENAAEVEAMQNQLREEVNMAPPADLAAFPPTADQPSPHLLPPLQQPIAAAAPVAVAQPLIGLSNPDQVIPAPVDARLTQLPPLNPPVVPVQQRPPVLPSAGTQGAVQRPAAVAQVPSAVPVASARMPAGKPPVGVKRPAAVAPRLQVTDILQVLARLLAKSQWEAVQQLVQKWRKTEKPSAEASKKNFITELREVVGNDLWRDTILEIQKNNQLQNPQPPESPATNATAASPATQVVTLATTTSLPLQPNAQTLQLPTAAQSAAEPGANTMMTLPTSTQKSGGKTGAALEGSKRAPSVREVINAVKWLVKPEQHATLDMLSSQYVKNQITQHQLEARLKGMIGHDGLLRAFTLATKNLPQKPTTGDPLALQQPAAGLKTNSSSSQPPPAAAAAAAAAVIHTAPALLMPPNPSVTPNAPNPLALTVTSPRSGVLVPPVKSPRSGVLVPPVVSPRSGVLVAAGGLPSPRSGVLGMTEGQPLSKRPKLDGGVGYGLGAPPALQPKVEPKQQLGSAPPAVSSAVVLKKADSTMPAPSGPSSQHASQAKHIVAHAYHCRNNVCPVPKCFDTKCKLLQLARHAEQCSNTPQTQQSMCKLCRMWNYVKNMPDKHGSSSSPATPVVGTLAKNKKPGGASRIRKADHEKMKQTLRQRLQEHFRACPGCSKCKKWQEQLQKVKEKQREAMEQGAAAEQVPTPKGRKKPAKRQRVKKEDFTKSQRLEGLSFEEGDWVEVTARNEPGARPRLARVMQIDTKVLVQYVARLGQYKGAPAVPLHTAKVVLAFEHVPLDKFTILTKTNVPQPHEYPDIEPPVLTEHFYVDRKSHGDESGESWWPAQILADPPGSQKGDYTVKLEAQRIESHRRKLSQEEEINRAAEAGRKAAQLEGSAGESNIVQKVQRDDLRLVCGHAKCRQRQVRFELPQMWCTNPACAQPVRYPGAIFFIGLTDEHTMNGYTPVGAYALCDACHAKAKKKQLTPVNCKLPPDTDINAMKKVTMPKEGQEHTGTIVGYDIGELMPWVQCSCCKRLYHQVCAMYNDRLMTLSWKCEVCCSGTFDHSGAPYRYLKDSFTVKKGLDQTPLSKYIENEISNELKSKGVDMQKTPQISIRVVSTIECFATTPLSVRQREWSLSEDPYPTELPYTSRAIMAFQNQDGAEVAIFCMYTQEYGNDCPQPNQNRVYISYLDSVRYFKCQMVAGKEMPRGEHRTTVYHSFLVAYLGYVRDHGFTHVHIWVEPPKQFDEYIFFARPVEDRYTDSNNTMKRDKLRQWYMQMLMKAQKKKIVDPSDRGIQSLCDAFTDIKSAREIPLFKGDQWEFTLSELIDGKPGKPNHQLCRQNSTQLITNIKKAMKDHKDHFLVAQLVKPHKTSKRGGKEPIVSSLFTNSREAYQSECVKQHWQFNNLRFAKYSTMMLVHYFISQPKPDYCKPDCKRGRVDDGFGMVGCEDCEKWFHYECVRVTAEECSQPDFDFICTSCKIRRKAAQDKADKDDEEEFDFFK